MDKERKKKDGERMVKTDRWKRECERKNEEEGKKIGRE